MLVKCSNIFVETREQSNYHYYYCYIYSKIFRSIASYNKVSTWWLCPNHPLVLIKQGGGHIEQTQGGGGDGGGHWCSVSHGVNVQACLHNYYMN